MSRFHSFAPQTRLNIQSHSSSRRTVAGKAKKRSKDTWQSNTGYLAIYPWIHCQVILDTFSGHFSAVFSWTHWIGKRQSVSGQRQTEDASTPEWAGASTEAVPFQCKWQPIQYDFCITVNWSSLWIGKVSGEIWKRQGRKPKRQIVSGQRQTEDSSIPEGAGVSTEAVPFQGKWQLIQYDFCFTVNWFSLWIGKVPGENKKRQGYRCGENSLIREFKLSYRTI